MIKTNHISMKIIIKRLIDYISSLLVKKETQVNYVKHFWFKVKNEKAENTNLFYKQVDRVAKIIKQRYETIDDEIYFKIGTVDDDFINDQFTLRMSINLKAQEIN